jgi:hypothetical protein
MHVLLDDDLGRLTLRRLRPWHLMLARSRAARLDRELADGRSPEASATLAARALRITSAQYRRDLAASLQRILAAAGEPSAALRPEAVAARPPDAFGAPMRDPAGAGYHAGTTAGAADARLVAGHPPVVTTRSPRVPLRLERISQSAPLLAALAARLLKPGPVPVQGVAMVSTLLADGTGPLYRAACRDDLGAIIERAAHALASLRCGRTPGTSPGASALPA